LAAAKLRRVGVLASPAVRLVGLYKARMEQAGLQTLFPEPQDEQTLLGIIKTVKAGRLDDRHRQDYGKVAGNLVEAGADALLVACTEFSVIGPPAGAAAPVIDALDVLVEATIAAARGEP
jgi:aspartate racemase